uniref:Major facilitator superfamily (MFS) profile domain-containing protein n=1 Tax=Periophthalmus magnuspinnatus TaxID=409849 RepID=A0A3B4B898_9GOBI
MNYYDEVTAFLGNWGRFQKILFFILCASVIPNGLGVLSVVFIVDNPKHHCSIPDVNLTEDWLQAIIPIEVSCIFAIVSAFFAFILVYLHVVLWSKDLKGHRLTWLRTDHPDWDYFGLSDQWKQPFTSTIYFVGVLVGSFFCGQLSDRFGRKPVFFITLGIQTLFTFLQVFSTSWEMYSVLMFFSGLGQIANYASAFVLGAEVFCGNVQTVYTTAGVCLGFSTGYMLLPLFAYFIRQWRFLVLAIALPGAVVIPLWWITPESPRWLLSQGRVEEAEAIIKKAADMNKVKAPSVIFKNYKVDHGNPRQYTVIDLYRNREMRLPSIILPLTW